MSNEDDGAPVRGGLIYGGPPLQANGHPEPTEEELNAARAAMFQQAVAECASQLSGFFPQKTDAQLVLASANALSAQTSPGMAQFLAEAVDGQVIARLPGWGVRVRRTGSTAVGEVGAILVPVDSSDVHTMDTVNQWVSVLALATSPMARGALELMGYEIQFVRTKTMPGIVKA